MIFNVLCLSYYVRLNLSFSSSCCSGLIAPVYSHATRRMKMHEIPVMQRRLVYTMESALEGGGECFMLCYGCPVIYLFILYIYVKLSTLWSISIFMPV